MNQLIELESEMQKLSPLPLGVAFGAAGAVFYIGCMIFMATATGDAVAWISNSVLHGVDVTSVMRESIPFGQSLFGILLTFIGGFAFGALSASIYNVFVRARSEPKTEC